MLTLIWLVVFVVVAVAVWADWNSMFSGPLSRLLPEALQIDEYDRYVWSVALGIVIATLAVNPISTLITLILLAIIAFLVRALLRFAMKFVH
ncbi:hypothetical protein [Kushneria phosphatilytica]|uniref:Uncharacterized protein n=1 Tax=Kushneria phosphatilytica TaxID=657387 RepID=A0A1S1NYA9_9GAMM|nr:hypothetical protein [Kushneria phosphatilytica]OHV12877.1 hypothetical protein BH688_02325 [Kushneria phosphatilytica]QEL10735.1 hypothetical protein FY550_06095 [Kushneria phosphatilytica]